MGEPRPAASVSLERRSRRSAPPDSALPTTGPRAGAERARAPATGPRIYNLFPLLAGPIDRWTAHLARIARMGFDWVYVNAFHEAGASGSLYAMRDPRRLDPRFRGTSARSDAELLGEFTAAAAGHGLGVVTDLAIASLARDSPLVDAHPEWVRRDAEGRIASPQVVDAADARRLVTWPDLAAIDYDNPAARPALVEFWRAHVERLLGLGIRGFVCKAAATVPAEIWRSLASAARADRRAVLFIADTVGAHPGEIEALSPARFDYVFNSARWWDFRSGWLLDQRRRLRHVAPSIAFPESHDSGRVAAAPGADADLDRRLRLHLLFSAFFSAGWMMPVGCEHGFRRALDPVHSRPEDWEEPRADMTSFIAALNAAREAHPVLNTEGPVQRLTADGSPVVALLRLSGGHALSANEGLILLVNPDPQRTHSLRAGDIYAELGGRFERFADVTPQRAPIDFTPGSVVTLEPLEARAIHAMLAERGTRRAGSRTRVVAQPSTEGRVTIEAVMPEIDGGRHPAKRVVGDILEVGADIFLDGHEQIAACVRYKAVDEASWREAPMTLVVNDRWQGRFALTRNTSYVYTVEAWRDPYESWRTEFVKRREAGQNLDVPLREGWEILRATVEQLPPGTVVPTWLAAGPFPEAPRPDAETLLLADETRELMRRCGRREFLTRYPRELTVIADRLAARYSAWYELFPRSQSGDPQRHGTFDDVIARLPYVRDLGFDVLYFTPIHPIGRTNRKGRNNSLTAEPGDPGSPYAIGSQAGGHDAVHPELGTLDDFRRLVAAAHDHGLEIALDIAVQCSLDHPWLHEHPDWFEWRPDGTIKHAENPPKKYEDIVNPQFYGAGFPDLWYALRDIIRFWIDQGVAIFRIDNPHTKPVPFWEWLIGEIRQTNPEVIFLSEAFTRPKMMRKLAKAGFTQSYTYFTWRNTKHELTEYLTELSQSESSEYFRPNFFTNTPDINPVVLQTGGRAAFMMRATLAATLSSAYGIYSGFELCEGTPLPGREEYLDSEKYEIKAWDCDRPGNIRDFIRRLNAIRRDNPALHDFRNLRFYNASDPNVLVYGKMTPAHDNFILVAVNLDPHGIHESAFELPLWEFGLPDWAGLQVEDLLGSGSFWWHGKMQRVRLDPAVGPAAIWRLSRPGDGGAA